MAKQVWRYSYRLYLHFIYPHWVSLKKLQNSTFTSTLPGKLLNLLALKAKTLGLPKSKLIETALTHYLEHLEKAEYVKSYRAASADKDILAIAEEGMRNYLNQLRS